MTLTKREWTIGGVGVVVGVVVSQMIHSPPPPPVEVKATAAVGASVRPSRQVIRIPVPGATRFIEIFQECPEVSVTSTVESVVRPAAVTSREGAGDKGLWKVALGVGATLPPVEWNVTAGVRIGTIFGAGWGVQGMLGGAVVHWVPTRYGAAVLLVF